MNKKNIIHHSPLATQFKKNVSISFFNSLLEDEGPIDSFEDDIIGFRSTCEEITDFLLSRKNGDPTVAISVLGEWGSGKTSMFNILEREWPNLFPKARSSDAAKIRFVRLDAADFSQSMPFFVHFYDLVLSKVEEHYLMPLFLRLKIVRAISGLEAMDSRLSTLFVLFNPMPNIRKYDQTISGLLKKLDLRMVVMLDDLDRMQDGEVGTAFRLLRLAQGMENVTFVVASDPGAVYSYAIMEAGV